MATEFESHLDVQAMIRRLSCRLPDIQWKLGDSEYDGFYVLGRTKDGIRIKITEEPGPGWNAPPSCGSDVSSRYHVGVYFFGTGVDVSRFQRIETTALLQQKIKHALEVKGGG